MQFKVLQMLGSFSDSSLHRIFKSEKNLGYLFRQKIANLGSEKLNCQIIILLDNLRTLYRYGTNIQKFFSLSQAIENSRHFQFLRTDILQKTFQGAPVISAVAGEIRDRTYNGTRSAKTDDRVRISKRFFKPHRLSEIIVTINLIFVKTKIIIILFCPLPSLV